VVEAIFWKAEVLFPGEVVVLEIKVTPRTSLKIKSYPGSRDSKKPLKSV